MASYSDILAGWFDRLIPPGPPRTPELDYAKYGGVERRAAPAPAAAGIPTLTDAVAEPAAATARPAAGFGAAPRVAPVSMGAEFDAALRGLAGGGAPPASAAVNTVYPPNAGPQPAVGAMRAALNSPITRAIPRVGGALALGGTVLASAATNPAITGAVENLKGPLVRAGDAVSGAYQSVTANPMVSDALGAGVNTLDPMLGGGISTAARAIDYFRGGAVPVAPAPRAPGVAADPAQNARELARQGTTNATPFAESPERQSAAELALNQSAGFGALRDGDINARIQNIKRDPAAFIDLQASRGIQATVGPDGTFNFAPAVGARPKTYDVGDGTTTTNYSDSAQYKGGVARAQADQVALAKLGTDKELAGATDAVKRGGTVSSRAGAIELYKGVLARQAAAQTAGVAVSELQRKTAADQNKFLLDAQKTLTDAGLTRASTAKIGALLQLGAQAQASGAAPGTVAGIVSGRPGDGGHPSIPVGAFPLPGAKDQRIPVFDPRTQTVQLTEAKPVPYSAKDFDALTKKYPGKTRAQILQDLKNSGQDVSGLKP